MQNKGINSIAGNYQYNALKFGNAVQKQWHRNRHNLIDHLQFFDKKDVVLDAGCGSGNVVLEYASKVKSITGVDNNKNCIKFLNSKIKSSGIINANVLCRNLVKDDFGKNKYSKILLTEVVEHFSDNDVRIVLKKINKSLGKNGKLLVTTPNYHSAWSVIEKTIDLFELSPKLWGEQHLIKFTPEKFRDIFEECGYKVEKMGTLNLMSPIAAYASQSLADRLSRIEFNMPLIGNLLFAVLTKK